MSFVDVALDAAATGKTITGLAVSKTAVMTLEVATGVVNDHQTGEVYTLAAAQDHVFSSDGTYGKRVQIMLIDNGAITDIWVDEYLLDDLTGPADVPTGYTVIQDLAWFDFDANETNLDNATIYRRVWA